MTAQQLVLEQFNEDTYQPKIYNSLDYKNQERKILEMLVHNDFVPTSKLREFAYQYNARIYTLRHRDKHVIEACTQNGVCGFRLISLGYII